LLRVQSGRRDLDAIESYFQGEQGLLENSCSFDLANQLVPLAWQ
jgi:hypothetical protein